MKNGMKRTPMVFIGLLFAVFTAAMLLCICSFNAGRLSEAEEVCDSPERLVVAPFFIEPVVDDFCSEGEGEEEHFRLCHWKISLVCQNSFQFSSINSCAEHRNRVFEPIPILRI